MGRLLRQERPAVQPRRTSFPNRQVRPKSAFGPGDPFHEHGGRLAIALVVGATTFSLSAQAYLLGRTLAGVALALQASPGLLLLGLLPHALPELIALFLPLAAWIIASRRGEWEQLLAATLVTVAIALPVLLAAAFVEVYVSPRLLAALVPAVTASSGRPQPSSNGAVWPNLDLAASL